MYYNITIETIEMGYLMISSPDGATRFYDLFKWTVSAAVANYIEDELMG